MGGNSWLLFLFFTDMIPDLYSPQLENESLKMLAESLPFYLPHARTDNTAISSTKNGDKLRNVNKPLWYTRVRELVLAACKSIGLDEKLYGTHSLRSDAASFVANLKFRLCFHLMISRLPYFYAQRIILTTYLNIIMYVFLVFFIWKRETACVLSYWNSAHMSNSEYKIAIYYTIIRFLFAYSTILDIS